MNAIAEGDRARMERIAEGLPSKSEKIRRLAAAGFEKADIARFLGIRYQFVYNVLSAPRAEAREAGEPDYVAAPTGSSGAAQPQSAGAVVSPKRWIWTKVERGGRITLPSAFCEALGIDAGDDVQLQLDDGRVVIRTRGDALRSLQEEVRRYIPEGVSLVDELIAERRAEAKKEAEGD